MVIVEALRDGLIAADANSGSDIRLSSTALSIFLSQQPSCLAGCLQGEGGGAGLSLTKDLLSLQLGQVCGDRW